MVRQLQEAGCEVLRCNLDETSVCVNYDKQRGIIASVKHGDVVLVKEKTSKRGSLTHVAIICDDTTVQPVLPQFILGNHHILKVHEMQAKADQVPNNVFVVRAKSSWVNNVLMCMILQQLRACLQAKNINKAVLLLWDACPVHCHHLVWQTARNAKVFLCFVPTNMTWLQQPLDVYGFRRFKAHVRKAYRQSRLRKNEPRMTSMDVVLCIVSAIRHILQGVAWNTAFDGCGYSLDGRTRGRRLLKTLDCNADVMFFAPQEPSHATLLTILPRQRSFKLQLLIHSTWTSHNEQPSRSSGDARGTDNADDAGECNAPPAMLGSPIVGITFPPQDSWEDRLRPRGHDHRVHPAGFQSSQQAALSSQRVASCSSHASPCHSSMPAPDRVTMVTPRVRPVLRRPKAMARARKTLPTRT